MTVAALGPAAVIAAPWLVAVAAADHGAAARPAPVSPALAGVLAGLATLVAGILAVAIALRLTRKPPPDDQATGQREGTLATGDRP
jgi:hypothetical protein